MKRLTAFILTLFLALGATAAFAADDQAEHVRQVVSGLMHGQEPDSVRKAAVPGFYEVTFGTEVYYVSGDGRYLFAGNLVDLERQQNLTERRLAEVRTGLLAEADEGSMIVYGDEDLPHTVTVFTDIDCGYCRKLHRGMAEMNELGIRVRYLAFPRAGVGSKSYDKAVSVWCANDRQAAMDRAKAGKQPEKAECDAPVKGHLALGKKLGVSGTPGLVLESGRLLPGYIPPKRLLKLLEAGG